MKANELRIGNFISHMNVSFRIDEIRLDKHHGYVARMYPLLGTDSPMTLQSWLDLPIKDAQPIHLTEEYLAKFGFEKKGEYGPSSSATGEYYWESKRINLTPDFELITSDHYYNSNAVDGAIKMKYIHQLQNICFALTGEELTIN